MRLMNLCDAQVREVPVAVVAQIEAVADEELVWDGEAHVADGNVLDQAPVGPVEERDRGEGSGTAQGSVLHTKFSVSPVSITSSTSRTSRP